MPEKETESPTTATNKQTEESRELEASDWIDNIVTEHDRINSDEEYRKEIATRSHVGLKL